MDSAFVTTGFELEGFKVTKHLGIVRGITVRSRSLIGMRYDTTDITDGVTEVVCYGTAVVVQQSFG